jgi:dienelactone hydrolase
MNHAIGTLLTVACALSVGNAAFGAPQKVFFKPRVTDARITSNNDDHYAVMDPDASSKDQLVLVLPGTGARPSQYTDYCNNAASLGFRVLGLMYPNDKSINALCTVNAPLDPRVQKWARLEVIDGRNRVNFVNVNQFNSIESRMVKALQYLQRTNPRAGWGAFLQKGNVDWDKIIVVGHSQGGGMAGVIAKTRKVNRCVMFTDMDYWVAGNRPCDWMSEAPQTPTDRWYFLAHQRDQHLAFPEMITSAKALGLGKYGGFVQVETAQDSAFSGTHCLFTNLAPARFAPESFHGSVIVNPAIARNDKGVPQLKAAWDYMLLHKDSESTP